MRLGCRRTVRKAYGFPLMGTQLSEAEPQEKFVHRERQSLSALCCGRAAIVSLCFGRSLEQFFDRESDFGMTAESGARLFI